MCTLYTMVLVALLRYMKVYKMCWFCTLVHYGGGVGLVHLCARCAGGCAQIVLMVVQGTIVVLLRPLLSDSRPRGPGHPTTRLCL